MRSEARRRSVMLRSFFVFAVLLSVGMATVVVAVCVPTVYSVTSSAPPPSFNWTDTSGAGWAPAGGFPGCAPGDSASDTNLSPTTIIVNGAIPNPVVGLNLSCNGCVIDLQSGGSLTLAGPASIGGGASITLDGGTLNVVSGGNLTFNSGSTLQMNSGTLDIQSGAQMTAGGTSTITGGTMQVSGGTVNIPAPASLAIQSGGQLLLGSGAISGDGVINNAGSLQANGAGTFTVDTALNHLSGGTLTVNGGTLSLGGGGTGDAPFTIAAGATLDFPANTYTLTPNGIVSGAGTLQISGGTLSIGGVTAPDGFAMSSGTLTGAGFLSVTSSMDWSGGTITGSGGSELAGGASANLSGANGPMILDGRTINVYGYAGYSATTNFLELANAASLSVYGTFDFTDDGSILSSGSPAFTIAPNGVVFKSGGAGTSTIAAPTTNNASVDAFSGVLELAGDGTHNGSFYSGTGATIAFSAPSTTLTGSSSIFSDGTIHFASGASLISGQYSVNGTTTVDGSATVAFSGSNPTTRSLVLDSGTLDTGSEFHLLDSGTWSGGTIGTGAGTFYVDDGATLTIDAASSTAILDGGTLTNQGEIDYTADAAGPGDLELDNGAIIQNDGTFDIQTDAPIVNGSTVLARPLAKAAADAPHSQVVVGSPAFQNAATGTLKKSGGSGSTTFAPMLNNDGSVRAESGTISFTDQFVQTGGTTSLAGGDLALTSFPLELSGGVLDGEGTITGDVQNDASIAPGGASSIGTIDVSGNYTQGSGGTLSIDLDTAAADQLEVSGAATLDGTFDAALLPSATPPNGTTWTPLTFASRSGDFALFNLPSDPLLVTASYTPNSLQLTGTIVTDLSIAVNGPATVDAASALAYTVDVTNGGSNTTSGTTTVANTLPAGVSGASGSGTGWTCGAPSGGVITCTSTASIASGGAYPTLNFSMSAPPDGGSIADGATVSSPNDPNGGNDSDSASTTVTPLADLSITKDGPATATPGQNVVYTIVVTNDGPSQSAGVVVSDPTPANLTFVSNAGACTTPYPCSLGTLANGQSATITSTFLVSAGYASPTVSNTASFTSTTVDTDSANDSDTAVTPIASGSTADLRVTKSGPSHADAGDLVTFTIVVRNAGPDTATSVAIADPTPFGLHFVSNTGGCTGAFPCIVGSLGAGQQASISATYKVVSPRASITNRVTVSSAASDPNPPDNRAAAAIDTTTCPATAPQLLSPADGGTVTSDVAFSWTAVPGASSYLLTIEGDGDPVAVTTTATTASVALPGGSYDWTIVANGGDSCAPLVSESHSFTVCDTPPPPVASVIGETTTGQSFTVQWTATGAASYELQESRDEAFSDPETIDVEGTSHAFTTRVATPSSFFYRVRSISTCGARGEVFSPVVRVVVVPVPAPGDPAPNVTVPVGSTTPVTFQLFVPGRADTTTSFVATVDKPWLAVVPTSGIVPPDGILLTVEIDPTGLPNGTWTGTVIVVYGSTGVASRIETDGTTQVQIPISVSLVTPVTPQPLELPADSALIVPAVGHLAGIGSAWRSDLRIANLAETAQSYRLSFSSSANGQYAVKSTIITTDSGATTAFDDVVRTLFGIGSAGDAANGSLVIEPLDALGHVILDANASKTSVVSSRTYNVSTVGTLGQFVPAVAFPKFLHAQSGSVLSLQQLAQTADFRTNLGLVEVAGRSTTANVRVFDGAGTELLSQWITLLGGQQLQLNSFLASHSLSLSNARIEVEAAEGDGRITAYASVVDGRSGDAVLVPGVSLPGRGATRFVLPGIAALNSPVAQWRSDLRVFNAGTTPESATLTFFPMGNAASSISREVMLVPGEVAIYDDVLSSLFGVTNDGGALHVVVPAQAPLVVTGRTYDVTPHGTVGQFIPAVTDADAVGIGERALQLVQTESSVRYRTNVGLVEVSGRPVTVEISVHLPDSKITPVVVVPLGAFESRQFPVLNSLGVGAVYNARISIRVIGGAGRLTAYASVVDNTSGDATYVPAQ